MKREPSGTLAGLDQVGHSPPWRCSSGSSPSVKINVWRETNCEVSGGSPGTLTMAGP